MTRADRLREAANRATSGAGTEVEKARAEQDEQRAGQPSDKLANEVGAAQVQDKVDEMEDKGFFGEVPDDTPNEHYAIDGVTRGKPTPEAPRPPNKQ